MTDRWRNHHPFLFGEPEQANYCREWALGIAGIDSKLAPSDLELALGWRPALPMFARKAGYFAWLLKSKLSH